jgi:hypothetical protein
MPRLDAMIRARQFYNLALAASIAMLVSGCAPEVITPPAVTVTSVPVEHRNVVPSPPADPMPEIAWPLTGLSAEGTPLADVQRIAVGVKIENTSSGRPQKGLEYADIVFEEYINSSCSRLMAFFQSTYPEYVGPIRSARKMDPNIIGSFNTVLVASGTNHQVQASWPKDQLFLGDDFKGFEYVHLHESEGFERQPRSVVDKASEFRLWGHPATFAAEAAALGIGPTTTGQFEYAYPAEGATAALEGGPVGNIDIRYSSCANPHWVWNEAGGWWDRFEFENPDVTWDGPQITAKNVIILWVKVEYTQGYNPESFVVVDSQQPGFVATGGKVTSIQWIKTERRDTFHLTTLNGEAVNLAPGNTWIELVPITGAWSDVTVKFDGVVQ